MASECRPNLPARHPLELLPTIVWNTQPGVRGAQIAAAIKAAVAAGGGFSGALALIADSGHMVSEAAPLLLALIACRVAAGAAEATRTCGFRRVRVLAALVVRSAWSLVSDSLRVRLQAVPQGLDARAAEADPANLPGRASAGHLHARC